MLENKVTQENTLKTEKIGQTSINRPPLRTLSFENIPSIVPYPCQNPQHLKCYFDEIFSFLSSTEDHFYNKSDYFQQQSEITHASRAFLIDWLVGVHGKFRLMQETLYITVNLIDRYLSKRMVTKKQLQLVGLTAIFIAAKYEEIYPPTLKDFLNAADQAYSKQHLIKMEVDMLKVVDFQITFPTAWRFMEKYPDLLQNNCAILAEYILELGLVEYCMVRFKPSIQAAAVIYLANLLKNKTYVWKIDESQEIEIKECVKELFKIFKAASSHPLTMVREKYIRKKLDVAKLEEEAI